MKVALVYDRVNKWGGAERVLLALHEMFPEAPLYTSVYDEKRAPWAKVFPHVYHSFLQNIPILKNYHELLGWLTPFAYETFNFDDYDVVISVTSEAAKGIITKPTTKHICYCLTPTRYLWSGYEEYLHNLPRTLAWIPLYKLISQPFLRYAKVWDRFAAQRPDVIISISTAVKDRIKKYYGRDSEIIFPPVEIEKFQIPNFPPAPWLRRVGKFQKNSKKQISNIKQKDYYLIVSRLVPYKKIDLAIEAFNELGLPLVIVGIGSEEARLKGMAKKNIIFRGLVSDEELISLYKGSKALIFPQEEDFGITAVEAQAAGCPVIAYKKGGATDSVIDSKTGIFFEEQTKESLIKAVKYYDCSKHRSIQPQNCVKNAQRFSKERFKKEFIKLVEKNIDGQLQ